ncbi:MAG: double-strand break repair protein AddB [Alphaproteobacteria bacterium]|nr:double-strand break repair protein AddB [Alphaproteobacteria bacterium]
MSVLADLVLSGFPLGQEETKPPLSRWTILLPTRRACQALGKIFLEKSERKALLLPRIQPIGDLDGDDGQLMDEISDLPEAVSESGQLFILINLLHRWARENPLNKLAQEIIASPVQTLALATSLAKLVEEFETEEADLGRLGEIYEGELSEHRDAILSLLSIIRFELPKQYLDEAKIGKAQRRSLAIRTEAKRISQSASFGPIIAAGSTGTIAATRSLLIAISQHPQGAIILPGLDHAMEDEAWDLIKSDHPQFAMKTLLEEFKVARTEVKSLSKGREGRVFLASEIMRPTASTDKWREILRNSAAGVTKGMAGIRIIEAQDRHIEARTIALILREAIETPRQTAALMTPDRDLAKRVSVELRRWNITIDDTAGTKLMNSGLARAAHLLIEAVQSGFTPASVLALLHLPSCGLGLAPERRIRATQHLELAVLRNYDPGVGLENLERAVETCRVAQLRGQRAHPLVSGLADADWESVQLVIGKLRLAMEPFKANTLHPFAEQLTRFMSILSAFSEAADERTDNDEAFLKIMGEMSADAHHLAPCSASDAVVLILGRLRMATVQGDASPHPRLAIYGLLEARMMPVDILVMGGLNETKWPAQSDPGPWLNRTMRDSFGLQQPERSIGLSAHDFTQGLGAKSVYLTYAKRIETAPVVPSRWILRLQAVLQTAGLEPETYWDQTWITLASQLDAAETLRPVCKPRPMPHVSARPRRISVTEVEKLIRDPYAVYARRILRLEPLPALARPIDAALRGTLFHAVVNRWNKEQIENKKAFGLDALLKAGETEFASFMNLEDVAAFWWPSFVRIAEWLVTAEAELQENLRRTVTETSGELHFDIAGEDYLLHGRADRIDVLDNGTARIIDYKTGKPPTSRQVTNGLSPQLPLEAAILLHGKFEGLGQHQTQSLDYVHIGGSTKYGAIETIEPTDGSAIGELIERQLAGLKTLLTSYMRTSQPYLPRIAIEKEEDQNEYDHLSRFREWMLAGDAK